MKENPDRKKANSDLHLRTDFRGMMSEERLNSLSLVPIHQDIEITNQVSVSQQEMVIN